MDRQKAQRQYLRDGEANRERKERVRQRERKRDKPTKRNREEEKIEKGAPHSQPDF